MVLAEAFAHEAGVPAFCVLHGTLIDILILINQDRAYPLTSFSNQFLHFGC